MERSLPHRHRDPAPVHHGSVAVQGLATGRSYPFWTATTSRWRVARSSRRRIGLFKAAAVDRLDVVMAGVAEVDPVGLLPLAAEIVQRSRLLVAADGAGEPVDPPLAGAPGAEGIPHSPIPFQKTERGQGTADGAVARPRRFQVEFRRGAVRFPLRSKAGCCSGPGTRGPARPVPGRQRRARSPARCRRPRPMSSGPGCCRRAPARSFPSARPDAGSPPRRAGTGTGRGRSTLRYPRGSHLSGPGKPASARTPSVLPSCFSPGPPARRP